MEEGKAVVGTDAFELSKQAVLRKKEEIAKLLAERDVEAAKKAVALVPQCFEEVANLLRTAAKFNRLHCEVVLTEAPYTKEAEDQRARYLALKEVMNTLTASPNNLTIYEKNTDNVLRAWQLGGDVGAIEIEHRWTISCLPVGV